MRFHLRHVLITILGFTLSCAPWLAAQNPAAPADASPSRSASTKARSRPAPSRVAMLGACVSCIRANLAYLAGPGLHGRGSGTEDEHHAAEFIAGKLKQYGAAPAAGSGGYIQTATVQSRRVTSAPTVSFDIDEAAKPRQISWKHGEEIVLFDLAQPEVSGPTQKIDLSGEKTSPAEAKQGAVVLLKLKPGTTMAQAQSAIQPYMDGKAAMLIFPGGDDTKKMFDSYGKQPPHMPKKIGSREPKGYVPAILAKPDNFNQLWSAPEGTLVKLHADVTPWQTSHTWNVLGKFEGTDEKDQVILLSAHLDHLGVRNGTTYPGADDDASGTVAVLEFARALGKKPKLKRTVIFALWGSEEQGMVGSRYFLENPTFDLQQITANLEFEMIGRADAKVKPGQLWLTGWERTNLGPELAAHGAKLVGDPHPEQDFFERSDNIALARKGIVAQTVSSYGLHNDYHQPTDTVDKVDFPHMDQAIGSMIGPIVWLANSNFKPKWKAEEKP